MDKRVMLNKYTIFEINRQNMSDSEINDIYTSSLEEWREENPMFPKPAFEEVKSDFLKTDDSYVDLDFLIKDNSNLVATASVFLHNPNSDAPSEKKEKAWVRMRVFPDHRNKGIGTEILKFLINKTKQYPLRSFSAATGLEPGYRFCEKFGGDVIKKSVESYLDLEKVDVTKIEKLSSEITTKNQDVKIETVDNLTIGGVEEYIRLFAEFDEETSKYNKDANFDKDSCIENGIKSAKKDISIGYKKTVTYVRDSNGRAVGMSTFLITPESKEIAQQLMTGVLKDYRRRGLCRLLKSRSIIRLKELYPNIKLIKTVNDEENSSMRKINESLGFQQLPVYKAYTFELNKLKERLQIK